jgi:hypothetical protein
LWRRICRLEEIGLYFLTPKANGVRITKRDLAHAHFESLGVIYD